MSFSEFKRKYEHSPAPGENKVGWNDVKHSKEVIKEREYRIQEYADKKSRNVAAQRL